MARPPRPLCVGIAGGSGAGKSWLAHYLKDRLGPKAVIVSQDWYYRDNSGSSPEESLKLNFDHPKAIEAPLMHAQLRQLLGGQAVAAPRYDYATHARLKETRPIEPAAVVIVEGLLLLHDPKLRELMDFSVFVEVPDDIRLLRRIRRDVSTRRVNLKETLRLYEHCVKPMHDRYIKPSAAHATWIWRQLEDKGFPQDLLKTIEARLPLGRELVSPLS